MRIAVFRHVPYEDLGTIAPIIKRYSFSIEYYDLFDYDTPPDIARFDALVFMGGPMSVNDPLDYLNTEVRLIQDAAKAKKPILGVCLGSQLIAKAFGARVYPNVRKEIGWAPVYWTAAARQDRLFGSLTGPETVFHWHGETFDLPPGAEWLAGSDACRHQAFRIGDFIYGLQFHLEVTPAIIEDWIEQDAKCGDAHELTGPIDPHAHAARQMELAEIVFGEWAKLIGEIERASSPLAENEAC